MNSTGRWLRAMIGLSAVLLALVAANLLSLRLAGSQHQLVVGFRADRHFLSGFFKQEQDARGIRYRWTQARSELLFNDFIAVRHPFITLHVGGLPGSAAVPRPLALSVDDQPWLTLPVQPEPRRYALVLPPAALQDGNLRLGMASAVSNVYPDPRQVGIRLDRVTIGWDRTEPVLPTPQTLLVQWAIVGIGILAAWRLALPGWSMALIAGAVVILLGWMTGYDPSVAATWQQRLLLAALALLLLVWSTFPRLALLLPGRRPAAELRLLLLLTIGILGIRLFGALYPTFDAHDWYIHEDRLHLFQYGSLLLFDKPAEFSNRVAIVPPAPYILVAPFTLFTTDTVPTTQGVYTFLEGWSLLLLAILVRQIGGSARAAVLALLALAFLPIQLTALWWGFGPQVIGQALLLLLAVFAAQERIPSRMLWAVAAVVLCVVMLSHNGVTLLGGFWLAGYVALNWWFQRQRPMYWQNWALIMLASAIICFVLLYIDVVALQLRGVASNDRLSFTEGDIFRVKYTLGSLCASFQPLSTACDRYGPGTALASVFPQVLDTLRSVLLSLLCLCFVIWRARGRQRWLASAWLGSAALFFAADMATGLQVRYAYFTVPLFCAGLGMLLDRLMTRHRLAWLVSYSLLGLIVVAGLTLWYEGVELAIKPSLRLLTH